jgi:hypothetical protein
LERARFLNEETRMADYSGWLWVIIDIVAVAILAGVIFYAARQYAHRNRRNDALSEEVTRRNYREEDREALKRDPG